jgi:hypothetical protein
MSDPDIISGRDALQRLDDAVERARGDFTVAQAAADGSAKRRSDLLRLRAEGYRQLARIRLDVLKAGADVQLTAAETKAIGLLDQHAAFVSAISGEVEKATAAVADFEARRREAASVADLALHAYEAQVAATEARLQSDPTYLGLKTAWEEVKAR